MDSWNVHSHAMDEHNMGQLPRGPWGAIMGALRTVNTVQNSLEVVPLSRVLRIEKIQQLDEETLVYVLFDHLSTRKQERQWGREQPTPREHAEMLFKAPPDETSNGNRRDGQQKTAETHLGVSLVGNDETKQKFINVLRQTKQHVSMRTTAVWQRNKHQVVVGGF